MDGPTRKDILKFNKVKRCQYYQDKCKTIPLSYKENTLKEELILEHLIQYRKEFSLKIDPNRDLFLYPKNECEKYKFICTTIRPTKVPYPELYDFVKCSQFVSEFIEYEELSPPNEFPKYIPAPDNVILWQLGDCFDMSIVLCSLLIGAGYNAFVVYGKAPRYITTKDESNLPCPELLDNVKIIQVDLSEKGDGIPPKTFDEKPVIESSYDKSEKEEKEKKQETEWIMENIIDDDEPELEKHDPWRGKRLHCWVLLKRNRRIATDTFVEPSTGRIYEVDKITPYESVDAIFNNYNFWINLYPEKNLKDVDFNLNNKDSWEYVMLNSKNYNEDQLDDDEGIENVEDHVEEELGQEILDMPPPWPNKLYISKFAYNNRTPLSTQTFYYKKTRVDKFAPYSQIDGLILRIFKFKDYARMILEEVEYRYRNRTDKLYKRKKFPFQHKTIDYYMPGHNNGWKEVEEVEGLYRINKFYETNYSTGLICREEIFGEKIIHKYQYRDDRIVERRVRLNKKGVDKISSYKSILDNPYYSKKILITKFTQKYLPNPLIPVHEQIAKLTYKFDNNTEIFITYNYAKGKITAETEYFLINDNNESSLANEDKDDSYQNFNSDKDKLKKKLYSSKNESINNFIKIEDDYNLKLVDNIKYNQIIQETKVLENDNLFEKKILEKNIFDQDMSKIESKDKQKSEHTGSDQKFDRIAFFLDLEKNKLDSKLTNATSIKNEIIRIFKDEKMAVTHILQEELKELVNSLKNEIEEFKNKESMSPKDTEDHNVKIDTIQRKINIIYERAHRHITKIRDEVNVLMNTLDLKF